MFMMNHIGIQAIMAITIRGITGQGLGSAHTDSTAGMTVMPGVAGTIRGTMAIMDTPDGTTHGTTPSMIHGIMVDTEQVFIIGAGDIHTAMDGMTMATVMAEATGLATMTAAATLSRI